MQIADLDNVEMFSLTLWKSERGVTVGVQRFAGDPVRYETRARVSDAIAALFPVRAAEQTPIAPPLPY